MALALILAEFQIINVYSAVTMTIGGAPTHSPSLCDSILVAIIKWLECRIQLLDIACLHTLTLALSSALCIMLVVMM